MFSIETSDNEIKQWIEQKEFSRAEQALNLKLQGEPESAETHYQLGIVYYYQGNLNRTIEHLKKSLLLDPQHTDAAICLSVLYNDIGKYEDAKKIFERANQSVTFNRDGGQQEIDRKFAVKHFEMGDLYFRYRRYDEAIEEYQKASALDSGLLEVRIRRAKAYAKKGFTTRAIQELQQLKTEKQFYVPARVQLGLLYFSQGNVLDAELEWESVLDLEPTHRETQSYLEMAKRARIEGQPASNPRNLSN